MANPNDPLNLSRQEIAKRRREAREHHNAMEAKERDDLKKLHWMSCPKCGSGLTEVQFRAVKVDKCFTCGGVYLDDGELELLTSKPGWFESMMRFFRG